MSANVDPESPLAAYRSLIDRLVEQSDSVHAQLVRTEGIFLRSPDFDLENEFVASLDPSQRSILARMLLQERRGAIHDVLAQLSWWISCRDVALTYRGEPMPVDQSGMGLHGDYIGRLDDWEWP